MAYNGKLRLRCGRCNRVIKNLPARYIRDVPYGSRCYKIVLREMLRNEKMKIEL